MVSTAGFLLIMAFLFKFTEIPKSWLWYATVMGLLAQSGVKLNTVEFIVTIGIFKVLKDIFEWY